MSGSPSNGFREALRRIASDNTYRIDVTANPKKLLGDFQLTKSDVEALRQAAIMSGADLTQVDALLSKPGVANYNGMKPMLMNNGCCCCCCCCGETGVEVSLQVA